MSIIENFGILLCVHVIARCENASLTQLRWSCLLEDLRHDSCTPGPSGQSGIEVVWDMEMQRAETKGAGSKITCSRRQRNCICPYEGDVLAAINCIRTLCSVVESHWLTLLYEVSLVTNDVGPGICTHSSNVDTDVLMFIIISMWCFLQSS